MEIKTGKEWGKLNLDMKDYLKNGDIVDQDIVNHFLSVTPPITNEENHIQIGEMFDYVNGKPVYPTLVKEEEIWVYYGNCLQGEMFYF